MTGSILSLSVGINSVKMDIDRLDKYKIILEDLRNDLDVF